MENVAKENKVSKTQVYNVVILDRSGSMSTIRRAAIDGFNETLAGIKKAQEKFADTQDHFVSLVAFCNCETSKIFDKMPASEARPLTKEDYVPCCGTPLYDAMGFTLTEMHRHVSKIDDAVVVVTVITDGMENASREYNANAIRQLVESLRGEGWTFTYMGANQDSASVAESMSIRNSRNFAYSAEGTVRSMRKDTSTRLNFFTRLSKFKEEEMSTEGAAPMARSQKFALYSEMADEAFDEEENKL